MTTVKALISEGERRLAASPASRLEAELLLAHVSGVSRAFLFAHPEQIIESNIAAEFEKLLKRRAGGEPIAYITGQREFWSIPFKVTPAVLIPRPETELLVAAALDRIPQDAALRIADLGTGSGAIAIALASERPRCEVYASDISTRALEVSRENAKAQGVENLHLKLGSWLDPIDAELDIIVSNPPYVAKGDPHLEEGDLRFEPDTALVPGPGGLEALRAIATSAPQHLRPGGWLLLEHGNEQGAACRELLAGAGFVSIETLNDLEGSERVTLGALPPGQPR